MPSRRHETSGAVKRRSRYSDAVGHLGQQEHVGSGDGRRAIGRAVDALGLQVATAALPHRIDAHLTIDHVALPARWRILATERHRALVDDVRISDHDAYVVEVDVI